MGAAGRLKSEPTAQPASAAEISKDVKENLLVDTEFFRARGT